MNINDPNIAAIELVAAQLGTDLCKHMVFVGGSVVGILITDPAMPAIRPTEDVDIVCEVMMLADYYGLEATLRERGFLQDLSPQAPICRWRIGSLKVDVMPPLESILGFANRWYPMALESAEWFILPSGRAIRVITAAVFIGTKLEAFHGRGGGDFLFSHDLGDIIAVIDGRQILLDECHQCNTALQGYLSHQFSKLLQIPAFLQALPGHLPPDAASQQRLPELVQIIRGMSRLTL